MNTRTPQATDPPAGLSASKRRYLGDAVYVSFNGFQLWLECEAPPCRIALDPGAYEALNDYVADLKLWIKEVQG